MYGIRLESKIIIWGLVDASAELFRIGTSRKGWRPARELLYRAKKHVDRYGVRGDLKLQACMDVLNEVGSARIVLLSHCPKDLDPVEAERWLMDAFMLFQGALLQSNFGKREDSDQRHENNILGILRKERTSERWKRTHDPFGLADLPKEEPFSWGA